MEDQESVKEGKDLVAETSLSPRPAPADIRLGDIFRFRYNQEWSERLGISTTHCFEGTLHARQETKGLILVDTYWGIEGSGRVFTLDDAQSKGTLTFRFNLNDVEPIKDYEQVYYADEDLFTVSEQHACVPRCVHWFKRKGATRNADKMLRVIQERVQKRKGEIDFAIRDIDRLAQIERQIGEGSLDVYL